MDAVYKNLYEIYDGNEHPLTNRIIATLCIMFYFGV